MEVVILPDWRLKCVQITERGNEEWSDWRGPILISLRYLVASDSGIFQERLDDRIYQKSASYLRTKIDFALPCGRNLQKHWKAAHDFDHCVGLSSWCVASQSILPCEFDLGKRSSSPV